MTPKMQRILVSFGFILVFETIAAIGALVLLFLLVIVQFFLRVKLFGLLWTTLAHKNALHLWSTGVLRLTGIIGRFSRRQEWSGL
jgi:hypothetical protein